MLSAISFSRLIYLPMEYPARYRSSRVSRRLMRPFPSWKGWMQRKSRMNRGISRRGSSSGSVTASRNARQRASMASGVSQAGTG